MYANEIEEKKALYENSGNPDPDECGIWLVKKPKSDYTGVLMNAGYFEGKFDDVAEHALKNNLVYDFSWVHGKIEKIEAKKI